jgi:phage repressor protein C with HTH and peptisase S24 domain
MKDVSKFNERLRELIAGAPLSKVAKAIGIGETTMRNYLEKGGLPGIDSALKIAEHFGVSLEWLITGEGNKIHSSADSTIVDNAVAVPVYSEVTAAAGTGAVNQTEAPTTFITIPVEFLPHGKRGIYKIIFVQGDSMEPTLCPRQPIIIDFGVHSILGTGVYVIRIDGDLFVKRLDKLPDGSIRVSSDNSYYEPFLIKPGSGIKLDIVGKVVMNIKVM